ncbi:MAG: AI-2E family transporter [Eubacterium sp.]
MADKNKFMASSKYFTISIYTVLTVLVVSLIVKAVFFWDSTSKVINNLISTLSPFLIGVLIAFLINPLVNWIRNTVLVKWLHIKNRGLNKLLAIFIAYFIVLTITSLGLIYIIPEIINSLNQLLDKMPVWANAIMDFINGLADKYPELNFKYIQDIINNADSTLQSFLSDIIKGMTTTIVSTGVSIIKFVFNFIVAIIVSCYLLIDKKMQARSIKRMIYAFFKEERANEICRNIRRAITIFSDFFDGKMIDSLIMGILCFICMMIISLFGIEGFANCALLVSIIVGITNMIPYFGPFLGGIPSVLLLCIYSPKSGIIFAILIIVLQQLDGNVIGPKILGDSTGLRPLWIIFAITLGGWLAGVAGMLLGVPCVAVISGLLEDSVNERLDDRGIDLPVLKNEKVRKKEKPKRSGFSDLKKKIKK